MGLRLDPDFTEETVGFAIESFLTLLSFPRHRFTVEPFSRAEERWLGADAHIAGRNIRGFRPFYMQFKRPLAYPDFSPSRIVKDRKKLSLSVLPRSLFFSLREKKPGHTDYQHNILFDLRQSLINNNMGDAAYICPLFLERSTYRMNIYWAGLRSWPRFWRDAPWDFEDVLINRSSGAIHFERIPTLSEHISIPPHAKVSTAKHKYSFNEAGSDLCFHSPVSLPDSSNSLAHFLNSIAQDFLRPDGKITQDTAFQRLSVLLGVYDRDRSIFPFAPEMNPDDPIGSWLFWGDILRRDFGIEQYAFIRWNDLGD